MSGGHRWVSEDQELSPAIRKWQLMVLTGPELRYPFVLSGQAYHLSDVEYQTVVALRGSWDVESYPTPQEAAKALVDTAIAICTEPNQAEVEA